MREKIANYWRGKTVFLTGASSGLGAAVVEALAPLAKEIGMFSRRREPMENLAEKLSITGCQFHIYAGDVRDRLSLENAIQEFAAASGRLDVVWANSGISGRASFGNWDWEAFENVIDTNLKGVVYTIMPALEIMARQGTGTVVAIGSAASMRGLPRHASYSLTKIALHYFMESMAIEVPFAQFTTIHPGWVDTPINTGRPGRFWLMGPDKAAQLMLRAVARKKSVYIYPFRMNLLYRFVRKLPAGVYRSLAKKALGEKKSNHS